MAWKNIGPNKNTQFLEGHIEIGKSMLKKKSNMEIDTHNVSWATIQRSELGSQRSLKQFP
jgi:hypothetical protein